MKVNLIRKGRHSTSGRDEALLLRSFSGWRSEPAPLIDPVLDFDAQGLFRSPELGMLYDGPCTPDQLSKGFVLMSSTGSTVLKCYGRTALLLVAQAVATDRSLLAVGNELMMTVVERLWKKKALVRERGRLVVQYSGEGLADIGNVFNNEFFPDDLQIMSPLTLAYGFVPESPSGSGYDLWTPLGRFTWGSSFAWLDKPNSAFVEEFITGTEQIRGGDRVSADIRAIGKRYCDLFPYSLYREEHFFLNGIELNPERSSPRFDLAAGLLDARTLTALLPDMANADMIGDIELLPIMLPVKTDNTAVVGVINRTDASWYPRIQRGDLEPAHFLDGLAGSTTYSYAQGLACGLPPSFLQRAVSEKNALTLEAKLQAFLNGILYRGDEAPTPLDYTSKGEVLSNEQAAAILRNYGDELYRAFPFNSPFPFMGLPALLYCLAYGSTQGRMPKTDAGMHLGVAVRDGQPYDVGTRKYHSYILDGEGSQKPELLMVHEGGFWLKWV